MSATMAARARPGASLSAPVRRAQPARRKSSPWFARLIRTASRRPGRALILLVFGIVSLAIVANALMFQTARHPHPILSAPRPVEEARPAARRAEPAPAPAAAPPTDIPSLLGPALPPSRPSDLSQAQPAVREAAPRPPAAVANVARTPAPAPAPAAAPAPRAAAAPAPRDPIADLINGADMRPPAEIRGGATRSAAAPRRTASN